MKKIDRFDKYMEIKQLNDNQVTVQVGLSVGLLGKSRKSNRDLSDKAIEQILNFYTDLDRVWLLTGEGDMLKKGTEKPITGHKAVESNKIPLLPLNAIGGSLVGFGADAVLEHDCEMMTAPIHDVDFAITVYGDSMYPAYPNGCRVFVKRIDPTSYIPWGSVFVLDTTNGIILKEVQPSDKEGYITCHSLNPSGRFKDYDVPLKDIRGMFKVLASLNAQW